MKGLTSKQEKFVDGICDGLTQSEAYRNAYECKSTKKEVVAKLACRLCANEKIFDAVEKRKQELADKKIWSREQALDMLVKIAKEAFSEESESGKAQIRAVAIKAIDQANKMCGYNEPNRQNENAELPVINIIRM